MKLSENFTLKEFTKSITASRNGLVNEPNAREIENIQALVDNILQPVRDYFGCAINIASGYRSADLNNQVGGANRSQHMAKNGAAADIDNDGTDILNMEIFYFIKNGLDFDQLIWEFGDDNNPEWVHVSYVSKEKNRNKVTIAYKQGSLTKYRQG